MIVRPVDHGLAGAQGGAGPLYLEHGAHWAIGALAVILLISIGYHVPEVVTGLAGVALIGAAYVSSVVRNRRAEAPSRDLVSVDR